MKGVGGPLLCIGDLLSDLAEKEDQESPPPPDSSPSPPPPSSSPPSPPDSSHIFTNSNLTLLFQENYARLSKGFAGTDHSWTALTLQLCSALENANKLVRSTNSSAGLLSEKLGELEKIIARGNTAVAKAKALHTSLSAKNQGHSSRQ